ncbi:hypothetical protein HJC23_003798 [Cyclotella cryptica]|uniref:ATP-dependent RNA helicase n=1 Tax=Cyclotella cryptica TaxID=29204 RepID=A0ABD3PZ09_9STRA|eukprot:CCRYP_009941-RA/>CCRYP_009941-RA protein AED:0.00 eAED:0.00 QI:36/-1/1/1/-1/1/1/223/505
MTGTTAPDPPECPKSSGASFISLPPPKCDDHDFLLRVPPPNSEETPAPPPRTSSDKSSSRFRRLNSVDPPEVLFPIDSFDEAPPSNAHDSMTPSSPATAKEMAAALALVPYDDYPQKEKKGYTSFTLNELFDPGSPSSPSPTHHHHALVMWEEPDMKHRSSVRELVPYENNHERQLVVKRHSISEHPTRRGFDHCFVSVPFKERLSALFATLRRNAERKVIVICATWESAKFHALLFRQLELFTVYEMHESMEDVDVVDSHDRFLYTYPGVLFASDIALQEFDVPPNVDYILQYEPPMDPTEYIYRFSTANLFQTSCHKALLFLSPEGKQMNFMRYFEHAEVEVSELQARKVSEFQGRVEKLILKHTELNEAAWKAFRSYVLAFQGHSHQDVYDKKSIDEEAICKSFAMPYFPCYVASQHKEDNIVKEFITKESKGERSMDKEGRHHHSHHHYFREENAGEEKVKKQASWMKGKERTWRSRAKKSWMNKEKSWKHAHASIKFASD